jgi:hypothetical protein
VRPERIVRLDRLGNEVGPLRLDAIIDVLAKIAVRPAIEAAIQHRSHVIRHQVAADLVALVDDDPELTALRIPRQAVRIAQAGGEETRLFRGEIDLQHGGAVLLFLQPVLADIGIGSDRRIELRAVLRGGHVLGPVVVPPRGQVDDLLRWR